MIKGMRATVWALLLLPFLASKAVSLEPIDLNSSPQARIYEQKLIGIWEGSWFSDGGYSNSFRLTIKSVSETGYIWGSRMYTTQNYESTDVPTSGWVVDGQVQLDDEKGKDRWIKLKLFKDEGSDELWLKGRYSTIGGGTVYLGDIDIKKVSP